LNTPAHVTHEDFDLLIEGGTVITGDPERPLIRSAWMGVKDGRITWLDRDPPPARRAGRQLSLRDHFITPGFVNVHSHAILTMVRGVAADLGFAPSYTPGIPKGTQVNPDQARALARLGALEALSFGSTLLGDNFVHADVCADAMCELGLRLAPSWRIHDVDFSTVARGEWRHEPGIGERTLRAGLADRIGSLRVGKQADFVAIDASRPHLVPHVDPLGNLVHTGQGRDVSHVAVDGELLIEHGEPTRVDRHRIVAEAEQAARALWSSEGKSYWLQ
jgi:cytosine/adenosine deaminase-related metal-dependent hydrolase